MNNEPQTIGGLFEDLECELSILAIAMKTFIKILTDVSNIQGVVKRNEDFMDMIDVLGDGTRGLLGFR